MDKTIQIDTFSRFTRVSRETITSLMLYEKMLIKANKSLNLIGNSTINQIWTRHFLDSSQVIDFIDKNKRDLVDIGTGAGFPGLVIAILARDRKIGLKVRLIEKSRKKVSFLEGIIKNLKLDVDVLNQNVLDQTTKLKADLIIARAFKPLKIVLDFLDKNTENWKKIFLFLGKTGRDELLLASKTWNIKYKQIASVTNSDSIIIEINRLSKK